MRRIGMMGLVLLAGCGAGASVTGPIANACMSSPRTPGPIQCACIQQVAHQTLTGGEQSRAARFFRDPDRAQAMRAADDVGSEAFWARYRAFADTAAASCG